MTVRLTSKSIFRLFLVPALLTGLVSAAIAADGDPELVPAVPKMDQVPRIDPLRAGVEHNTQQQATKKKRKKLKVRAGKNKFDGRTGSADADRGGLESSLGQSQLESEIQRGIGIIGVKFVAVSGHPPLIHTVFPGTPAAELGVRPDDEIVAVDGVPTSGLTREECYDLIVGTPNTPVTLSLKRGYGFVVKTLTRMDFNDIKDARVRRAYLTSQ